MVNQRSSTGGGPPSFLKVLDDKTLAFVDFVRNRQYITLGNLSENPKATLFLIDYAHRRRIARDCETSCRRDTETSRRQKQNGCGFVAPCVVAFNDFRFDPLLLSLALRDLRGKTGS